jgi:predicted MFS family arabinose efflux permease
MPSAENKSLAVLGVCCLAASLGGRVTDPIVPLLADHFAITVAVAALLSTGFALPYGLCQPVLGPFGDIFGKASVLRLCTALMAVALTVGALADSLGLLFASRIVAGAAAGGVIPLALALVGDRVEPHRRQVALARIVAAAMLGQLIGVASSGVLGDAYGWRAPLWLAGFAGLVAAAAAILFIRRPAGDAPQAFSVERFVQGYRLVFANPRAVVCYASVFIEGGSVYGLLPFVAETLRQREVGSTLEAGFVIAGLGLGGIIFSIAAAALLRVFSSLTLMKLGGLLGAAGLLGFAAVAPWQFSAACFLVLGFGFFMLYTGLQNRAVGLAPAARGSAVALHAFFFFLGQGIAPVVVGPLLHTVGATVTLVTCAALLGGVGLAAATLLARIEARQA